MLDKRFQIFGFAVSALPWAILCGCLPFRYQRLAMKASLKAFYDCFNGANHLFRNRAQ